MATPREIQAQLDSTGSGMDVRIMQSAVVDGTYDEHYCIALTGATVTPGIARWVRTTSAQTAAQQATTIRNGLTV